MDRLRTVIQAMPEEWRDVFILSRFDDQSPLAIAEMLQVSRRTVERRLRNALAFLTHSMRDHL